MSQITRWESIKKELSIIEVPRIVYKVQGKKARLTKDSAILEALKKLAKELDGECQCSKGDDITPPDFCGCYDRRNKFIERMTPIVKQLPTSLPLWNTMINLYKNADFLDDSVWNGNINNV